MYDTHTHTHKVVAANSVMYIYIYASVFLWNVRKHKETSEQANQGVWSHHNSDICPHVFMYNADCICRLVDVKVTTNHVCEAMQESQLFLTTQYENLQLQYCTRVTDCSVQCAIGTRSCVTAA